MFHLQLAMHVVLLTLEAYRRFGGDAPVETCTNELIEASELSSFINKTV